MIEQMYKTPQLYNQMAESICPTVFGHMEVKRGVLLMLLGGVHKKTIEVRHTSTHMDKYAFMYTVVMFTYDHYPW